jgi:hypothetical protein
VFGECEARAVFRQTQLQFFINTSRTASVISYTNLCTLTLKFSTLFYLFVLNFHFHI